MALWPCNVQNHRYPGKSRGFYVSYGRAQDYRRWKLRFCSVHAAEVHEHLAQFEIGAAENTARRIGGYVTYCLSCGQPLDQLGWQLFVTAYPSEDERKDYWAGVHVNCRLPEYLQDPGYDTSQAS